MYKYNTNRNIETPTLIPGFLVLVLDIIPQKSVCVNLVNSN
jgi:hypothetical protein